MGAVIVLKCTRSPRAAAEAGFRPCIMLERFHCFAPNPYRDPAAAQFLRLLRLAKLARVVRVQRFFRRWENLLSINYSTLKLCFFVALTLVIAHWIACGLFLITSLEPHMVRHPACCGITVLLRRPCQRGLGIVAHLRMRLSRKMKMLAHQLCDDPLCAGTAVDVAECIQRDQPQWRSHGAVQDLLCCALLGNHDNVRSRQASTVSCSDQTCRRCPSYTSHSGPEE